MPLDATATPRRIAATPPDGRRLRGDASRRAIVDAATGLLADAGVAALSHRAVATAAGVPLARVSYHFPTVDDLLVATASDGLERFHRRLAAMADDARAAQRPILDACTDLLHDLVTSGSAEFLGLVEIRLALHRRGRSLDGEGIVAVIESFGADRPRAASIAAAMFGFAVLAASEPAGVTRAEVRAHVANVLGMAS